MEFKITESQLGFLTKNIHGILNEIAVIKTPMFFKYCKSAVKNGITNSPWCQLKDLYENKLPNDIKFNLASAVDSLVSLFPGKKHNGIVNKIILLCLQNESQTANDLILLSDFLINSKFKKESLRKRLKKIIELNEIPSNEVLEKILTRVKFLQHNDYELSFVGDEFDLSRTSLSIDFRCSPKTDEKLIVLIQKLDSVMEEQPEERKDLIIKAFSKRLIKCIENSMNSITTPIKSDLTLKKDLYVVDGGEKVKVLDSGFYEVKKIDPLIDSYLSEFFSIFKETEISNLKGRYINLYNKIIDNVFIWVKNNQSSFLDKVSSNLKGIIYSDNQIIPIKYIKFYWSNKGRGGCNERRLSIRYRLRKEFNPSEIEIYKFEKGSDIVTKVNSLPQDISKFLSEEDICPTS